MDWLTDVCSDLQMMQAAPCITILEIKLTDVYIDLRTVYGMFTMTLGWFTACLHWLTGDLPLFTMICSRFQWCLQWCWDNLRSWHTYVDLYGYWYRQTHCTRVEHSARRRGLAQNSERTFTDVYGDLRMIYGRFTHVSSHDLPFAIIILFVLIRLVMYVWAISVYMP